MPELESRWLLLIHQIPPKPDYLRVKIWRRLQRLGSVPVKNSVYVLPKSEQAQEDFQWVLREVIESGGDASLCEARFVDGLTDNEVEELFRSARQPEYREISREAERLRTSLAKKSKISGASTKQLAVELEKLHKRVAEITAIDFFGAPGREAVERQIFALDARLRVPAGRPGFLDAELVSTAVLPRPSRGVVHGRQIRAGPGDLPSPNAGDLSVIVPPDRVSRLRRASAYFGDAPECRVERRPSSRAR